MIHICTIFNPIPPITLEAIKTVRIAINGVFYGNELQFTTLP